MKYSELLRSHTRRIAERAIETADCTVPVEVAEAVVCSILGDGPLDLARVEAAGLLPGERVVLLRAIETACLDCLYLHGDNPRETALTLRERFRPHHPKCAARSAASFFDAWYDPDAPLEPAQAPEVHRCLATILANVVEMVYVHDEKGTLLYANNRCEEVTGFTRAELLAPMTVYDFLPPEYLQLVEDRLDTLGPGPQSPFTLEILNKWGQRVPLEFTLRHLPLSIPPGEVSEFVLVCAHDCNLSRKLERQIASIRDLERRVIENFPLGLIVLDRDFIIREVNPPIIAHSGAAAPDDILGLPIAAFMREEDLALRAKLGNVLDSGEEARTEYTGETRFGTHIHCELTAVPLRDTDGEILGLILVVRDVESTSHDLQRVQAQKLQALGTTIAGVSHELNNPLTGIVGYTQLLLTSDLPPSIRTRVDHIAMEARRAQRIVQNLLTFAQRHETRKTLHDVNHVVSNVIALQEYQMRVDGIAVHTHLAANIPPTLIDVNALQTVCLHITNNAHQALLESGKPEKSFKVSTFVANNLIHIAFQDSGPGLSGDMQARIFDPFFTTRQPGAGPGLGLSVSYGIVQDHGGQILLDSAEGKGSTFTIVLPIREEASQEDPESGPA